MADALLVVDVQHGLVEALARDRRDAFLATVTGLIARARTHRTDVLFVRHGEDDGLRVGTRAWEIASDLQPRAGERIVDKRHADAFEATDLEDALRSLEVDHLIVCGMQSDHCVDATARGGARRDYRVTVVDDGHATFADGDQSEASICARINRGLREGGIGLVHAIDAFA